MIDSCKLFLITCLVFSIGCSASTFEDGLLANDNRDYKAAFEIWMRAAKAGDPESQFAIATLYHKGIGVKKDPIETGRWALLAAQQDHINAIRIVGGGYLMGDYGFEKNTNKAVSWFTQAAKLGDDQDRYFLAALYGTDNFEDKNDINKFYWSKLAVNYHKTWYMLGQIYYRGKAVQKDLIKSWVWFKLHSTTGLKEDRYYLEVEKKLSPEQKAQAEQLFAKAKLDPAILFDD